jgi:hypothetical protein
MASSSAPWFVVLDVSARCAAGYVAFVYLVGTIWFIDGISPNVVPDVLLMLSLIATMLIREKHLRNSWSGLYIGIATIVLGMASEAVKVWMLSQDGLAVFDYFHAITVYALVVFAVRVVKAVQILARGNHS